MNGTTFGDIMVAFADFMMALENARDKETFEEAKKYFPRVIRRADYNNPEYIKRGEEE